LNIHKIRENLIFDKNLIGNFYGFCSTEGFLDCVENSLGKIKFFEKMIFMIISNYLKCIENRKKAQNKPPRYDTNMATRQGRSQ